MPQISLYIDEATLKKVEGAASSQNMSISKWVAQQIRARIEPVYPKNYENLYGSISDSSFKRAKSLAFSADSKRAQF
jgi:hypothetical protein